jgi:hypothetical protein
MKKAIDLLGKASVDVDVVLTKFAHCSNVISLLEDAQENIGEALAELKKMEAWDEKGD